jgi:Clp amino terminal domain, pathogenicity island component
MQGILSDKARQAMMLADQHARRLNHDYIGTEHILLGLMSEPSGQIADLLGSLGAHRSSIEQEIEKLISRGQASSLPPVLPLTPRSRVAIELAHHEAAMLSQKFVEPEHLLLGLILQDDGVAARALGNVGLDSREAAHRAVQDRLAQMKIIERIVRPIRTPVARKRKMREEFLCHLDEIFQEELAQLGDRPAALAAAARRLGDPTQLSAELDAACARQRIAFYIERWIGWQAPESVLRFMTRVAVAVFVILAALVVPPFTIGLFVGGWDSRTLDSLRVVAAVLVFIPAAQFGIGMTYFQMRDALWGAFGSRRSLFRAFFLAGCVGLAMLLAAFGFITLVDWNLMVPTYLILPVCGLAILTACAYFLLARYRGPTEIRDTAWACLKIDDADPQIES